MITSPMETFIIICVIIVVKYTKRGVQIITWAKIIIYSTKYFCT